MKTKEWIDKLKKLCPEKELYFHISGDNGEDWGYCIPSPLIKTDVLEKRKYNKQTLIYQDNGEGKSLGECNIVIL
jgi:hypothetical protein